MLPKKLESTAMRNVSLTNTHMRMRVLEIEEDAVVGADPLYILIAIEEADNMHRDELFETFLPYQPTR